MQTNIFRVILIACVVSTLSCGNNGTNSKRGLAPETKSEVEQVQYSSQEKSDGSTAIVIDPSSLPSDLDHRSEEDQAKFHMEVTERIERETGYALRRVGRVSVASVYVGCSVSYSCKANSYWEYLWGY